MTTVGGAPATEVQLCDVELGDIVWTRFRRGRYVNYSRLGTVLRLQPAPASPAGFAMCQVHFIDPKGKRRYRTLRSGDTVFIEGYVQTGSDGV